MTAPPAGALEACLALLEKATAGEWDTCYRGTYGFGPESDVIGTDGEDVEGAEFVTPPCNQPTTRGSLREVDAAAIAAAVNLLRTHGPALLAALRLREGVEQARTELRLVACDLQLLRPNEPLSVAGRKHYAERINATADDLARVLEEGE